MTKKRNKIDDWSLKDMQIILPADFITYSLIRDSEKEYYESKDIEILKQKLIEDINSNDFSDLFWNDYNSTSVYRDWIINRINKRFGVEDDR